MSGDEPGVSPERVEPVMPEPAPLASDAPAEAPSRVTVLRRRVGTVIVVVVLALLAYAMWARPGADAPVIFRHATIISNTGMVQPDMTVVVKDGTILFVGEASESVPPVSASAASNFTKSGRVPSIARTARAGRENCRPTRKPFHR